MAVQFSAYKGRTSRAVSLFATLLNFCIVTLSGSMLGLGIWLVVEDVIGVLGTVLPSDSIWEWLAYGMIVTATFLIATGCLGIHSFLKEKRNYLILYCILMVVCFCGVCLFVGLPLWYREQVNKDLYSNMEQSLYQYEGEQARDDHSVFWNYVQIYHKCCAYDIERDYQWIPWYYQADANVMFIPTQGNVTRGFPASCCEYYSKHRPNLNTLKKGKWEVNPVYLTDCYGKNPRAHVPFSYSDGCYRQIKGMLNTNMTLMGSIASAVAAVMVLLFILGCFVISANTPREV